MIQTMKADELARYRKLLEDQRKELVHDIQEHGKIPTERVDAEDNDRADQANVAVDRLISNRIAASEDHLLEKVDLALSRMDAGTYGKCVLCGKEIPAARLEAKPSVSLCAPCQTSKEQR